jgi:hypothetical protein
MAGRLSGREVRMWAAELERAAARIGRHFVRAEPRERPVGSIRGLLSGTERKNGWQLAEYSHAVGRCRRKSHDFPPPTTAVPGSQQKLDILASRARGGLELWLPLDSRHPEDVRTDQVFGSNN